MAGVSILRGKKASLKSERNKIVCGGPHDDSSPGIYYRLTEENGVLEAECMECVQDVDRKWYTPEAVQILINEAVAKARDEWEAQHGAV